MVGSLMDETFFPSSSILLFKIFPSLLQCIPRIDDGHSMLNFYFLLLERVEFKVRNFLQYLTILVASARVNPNPNPMTDGSIYSTFMPK